MLKEIIKKLYFWLLRSVSFVNLFNYIYIYIIITISPLLFSCHLALELWDLKLQRFLKKLQFLKEYNQPVFFFFFFFSSTLTFEANETFGGTKLTNNHINLIQSFTWSGCKGLLFFFFFFFLSILQGLLCVHRSRQLCCHYLCC